MRRVAPAVMAAAIWGAGWLGPWPAGLQRLPWPTVGLALLLMIVPGACAARLLGGRGGALHDLSTGFAVSVAGLGLLGVFGSLLGASTAMPAQVFGGLGMATIALWGVRPRAVPERRPGFAAAVWPPLVVAAAVAALVAAIPDAGGDNFIYNAVIADFARGERLGFADPLFPGRLKISRLWLSYWQLVLAVLSQRTGIDVIPLTSVYVAPFLAVLGVLSIAALGRSLGLSRRLATAAACAQVVALLWLTEHHQPGWAFFTRLREDKVATAFVLAPLWLAAAADCLRRPTAGRAGLAALIGCGVLLAHPTVFVIALLILGLFVGLDVLATRRLRPACALLIPATALAMVLVGVRVLGAGASHVAHTSVVAALRAGDGYLVNAHRLEVGDEGAWFRVRPTLLGPLGLAALLGCAAVAVSRVGREPAARYVTAAVAVAGAVLVAPTAAVLGLAVTPFHLWRFLWLMPFGIALATAAAVLIDAGRRLGWWRPISGVGLATIEVVALLAATVSPRGQPSHFVRPLDWEGRAYWRRNRDGVCVPTFDELARMGSAIDRRGGGLVVADPRLNDFVPGASVRAVPLVFGAPQLLYELRVADAEHRWALAAIALDPGRSPATRFEALAEAGARFLVACNDPNRFDALQHAAGVRVVPIERFATLTLYAFEDP